MICIRQKHLCKQPHVRSQTCQQNRCSPLLYCFLYILYDKLVPHFVLRYCFHNLCICLCIRREITECSKTRYERSSETLFVHLTFGICRISDFTALHKNDRLMPILTYRSCRKPINIACANLSKHLFKADGRDMMTFIYNHHTIILHKRFYFVTFLA